MVRDWKGVQILQCIPTTIEVRRVNSSTSTTTDSIFMYTYICAHMYVCMGVRVRMCVCVCMFKITCIECETFWKRKK